MLKRVLSPPTAVMHEKILLYSKIEMVGYRLKTLHKQLLKIPWKTKYTVEMKM